MKSGKSMPVVESELIGHTRRMNWSRDAETSAAGPAPVIERFRWFWRDRGRGWLTLAALGSLLIVHHGYAKTDQAMIKEDATKADTGSRCASFLYRPCQRRGQAGRQAPSAPRL